MKKISSFATVVLLLLSFSSCDSEKSQDPVGYTDLFEQTADNIIIPSYAQFQSDVSALKADFSAFDTSDIETLKTLQEQFKATYLSWQYVSAFNFGPAAEYSSLLLNNCNSFPTNVAKIEDNIQSDSFNLNLPSNYEAKGLPALDYLLFHTSQSNLMAELTDSARINYIGDCIDDMQIRIDDVVEGWDSYRAVFIGSKGNDRNSSLSLLFNAFLYDYEQLKRNKFALPSGFATQYGIPVAADPSLVECYYSQMSLELIDANLVALQNLYLGVDKNGVDGVGVYEKLKEYNAQSTVVDGDLAAAIQEQFVLCRQSISVFENDLSHEIENNNFKISETSSVLQKLVPMIKNDMRSYLSVTVTSTDADGD